MTEDRKEKQEQLITLCYRCKERMQLVYELEEVPGSEGHGTCMSPGGGPHMGTTHQYVYARKADIAMRRALAARKAKIDMGGLRKDTRARYKEPWRER